MTWNVDLASLVQIASAPVGSTCMLLLDLRVVMDR